MPITYSPVPEAWIVSRRETVNGAVDRIVRMLTAANVSTRVVRQHEARSWAIYQQHFTDPTLAELDTVQRILQQMLNRMATGGLAFHYVPTMASFNTLGVGGLPPGVTIDRVEAFVTQRGVAAGILLDVYISPAFFTGNAYVAANPNVRTGTGTLLHELSHGVGNTADHAYTHEAAYAHLTAAQRAINADSYRAYCQGFDVI